MRCPAEFEVPPSPASDDRDRGESFTAAGSREQQVEPRATAPEAAGPLDEGRAETESPGAPSPAPPLEPTEGAHGARVWKTETGELGEGVEEGRGEEAFQSADSAGAEITAPPDVDDAPPSEAQPWTLPEPDREGEGGLWRRPTFGQGKPQQPLPGDTGDADTVDTGQGSWVNLQPSAPIGSGMGAGETLPPPPFGSRDPHARARRLARALVSDIAVYHPERRRRSLAQGTVRQEFREEIRKSWDEYVAQVGNEMARSTTYFQEALNEILAGGARLF